MELSIKHNKYHIAEYLLKNYKIDFYSHFEHAIETKFIAIIELIYNYMPKNDIKINISRRINIDPETKKFLKSKNLI